MTMTYREYAKKNGHSDNKIEERVGGLFGADAPMDKVLVQASTYTSYDMGNGYVLHSNYSSHDMAYLLDEDGNELESWRLD